MTEQRWDGEPSRNGRVVRQKWITCSDVILNRKNIYVYGDNMLERGLGGQAAAMRDEYNTVGVPTKWEPTMHVEAFFTNNDYYNANVMRRIDNAFKLLAGYLDDGRNVVIPSDGLGAGRAELRQRAPMILSYINGKIAELENR